MMNILKIGAAVLATATAFALPVNALAEAGAHVDTVANWHSNVVVDRELITGQQPMSAPEFGDVLVAKLNARTN
ncbi:hypothetical protein WI99_18810 [Burkholderia cepacia]|uniref:hypothetical protein n=1 Tax=Burkholderia cepacia TaxID=292 RepID=UPI000752DDA6|nr:hypothetical protein [Burkholderia cepacia]KVE84736.1 hypothetical protein WI99_18810 [Burkholderia cepacia]